MAILEHVVQLIRPQAERQGVRCELRRPPAPPAEACRIDPRSFQQACGTWRSTRSMPAGGELLLEAGDDGTSPWS